MKVLKKSIVFLMVFVLTFSLAVVPVQAATGLTKYKESCNYKKYDFTGDGKADKFRYVNTGMCSLKIYLNGKNMGDFTTGKAPGGTVYRWRVNNSNNFIIVQGANTGGTFYHVYRYKKGKLVSVYDDFSKAGFTEQKLSKVSGKYLYMEVASRKWGTFGYMNGSKGLSLKYKYKAKSGKIALESRYGTITSSKKFKAGCSFKTDSGLDKGKNKGVYVKKGDTVKLLKAYYRKDGYMWYKISVNGKTGWFKDSEQKILI